MKCLLLAVLLRTGQILILKQSLHKITYIKQSEWTHVVIIIVSTHSFSWLIPWFKLYIVNTHSCLASAIVKLSILNQYGMTLDESLQKKNNSTDLACQIFKNGFYVGTVGEKWLVITVWSIKCLRTYICVTDIWIWSFIWIIIHFVLITGQNNWSPKCHKTLHL